MVVGLAALTLGLAASTLAQDNAGWGGAISYTDSNGLNPVASPPYTNGYVVHTFTVSGTLILSSSNSANVLVVAGGGGGGGLFGDGGGAGGLVYTNVSLVAGTYSVTVGAGGAGSSGNQSAASGGNSVFGTLTALGGGGGGIGYLGPIAGLAGGSGGGSGGAAPAQSGGAATQPASASGGYGHAGFAGDSDIYGGGGGAGAAATSSAGGAGLAYAISGVNTYYAGGGGGIPHGTGQTGLGGEGGGGSGHDGSINPAAGSNGAANTGGGGGGGWNATGGSGGSGIIIVRYPWKAMPIVRPKFTSIHVSGTTLTLAATNGIPNSPWILLQSTNLIQWVTNSSSTYDSGGNLSVSLVNAVTNAQKFFKLVSASAVVPVMDNFFTQSYPGTRTGFTGNAGYQFIPKTNLTITALGRSVSVGSLQYSHQVTIWDTTTTLPVATVTVSPSSPVDASGYAYESLSSPVLLQGGSSYRITSTESAGGDPTVDITNINQHAGVATVEMGVYENSAIYPDQTYGGNEQGYGVPTFYFDGSKVDPALLQVPGPAPFIRDVTTGYLLQYSFMSPKPYCWPGTDILLSGWDVDQSGGYFDFSPKPNGLPVFNIDWFELVDTSPHGAITLKHQIAEQTAGPVTLEFRFNLPQRMDGAT
ncbi:MAG TPA: hypothetical protein VG077_15025, partial [Verrucomicrobiae bacterium]|nr:hypothetical protein [Verrucomicrobiae bacterium]